VRDENRWLPEGLPTFVASRGAWEITTILSRPHYRSSVQSGLPVQSPSLVVSPPTQSFPLLALQSVKVQAACHLAFFPIAVDIAAAQFLTLSRSSTGKLDGRVAARARNIKHDDRDNRDQGLCISKIIKNNAYAKPRSSLVPFV